MGCFSSTHIQTPLPTPLPPTPTPPPSTPPKFSSYAVNTIVDDSKDENKIDLIKKDYPNAAPRDLHGSDALPSNSWFDDLDIGSDEDGLQTNVVDYLFTLTDNNQPKPPKKRNKISFVQIDAHVKTASDSDMSSFETLFKHLARVIAADDRNKDTLTARAIVVWLSQQNLDKIGNGSGGLNTPRELLQLLKKKKITYASCYTTLCREARLMCVLIRGSVKAAGYEPGDTRAGQSQWTAVHADGSWQLVNPYWICKALYGHHLGGWVKIEMDGASLSEREKASEGITRSTFQEHYFMPNPKEYVYECFAFDTPWQLLPKALTIITEKEFLEMPYLLPPFFGLGLELVCTNKCLLESENGECKIEIKATSGNSHLLVLSYELFLQDNLDINEYSIPRMVFNSRSADIFVFDIRFPQEGTYKLVLYGGPHKSPQLRLCEFKLVCKARMKDCSLLPLDCKNIGWGPGPFTEEAGLLMPTKPSGLIAVQKNNRKTDIQFSIHPDMVANTRYSAILTSSDSCESDDDSGNVAGASGSKQELQQYINTEVIEADKMFVITVKMPTEGEYGVAIACKSLKSKMKTQKVICNYLLSTRVFKSYKANVTLAKKELKLALEYDGHALQQSIVEMFKKIEEIDKSIKKCLNQKIPATDDEISVARTRLEFLSYKYLLKICLLRHQYHVTVETLKRASKYQYKTLLMKEIHSVEHLLEDLKRDRRSINLDR